MQQCIHIKILFYFTSHKQRKNKEKLLQKLFLICYSFHQRYGELATNDMEDTYAQETVTQGDVLLYHICRILNTILGFFLKV